MRLAGSTLRRILLGSCASGALAIASTAAMAGGFGAREQSTEFQGMSFAGSAASGGGLSAMFWNSAAAAFAPSYLYSESHAAYAMANSEITAGPGSTLLALGSDSGDIANDTLVSSSYMSMRFANGVVFALATSSPFGLNSEPSNRVWAGQTFARTFEMKTYNFNPTLAYRVTPLIALGVGLQIQHIESRRKWASGALATSPNIVVQGDDTAFGFTAGVMFTPNPGTSIGLGFRSAIDHTLEGMTFLAGPAPSPAAIKEGVTLPEIVTLSLRQAVSPRLTVLGTVEWTNWSRLEKLDVVCAKTLPSPVFCPAGNGQLVNSLALGWHDGWLFSAGAEYAYSPALTLRGGIAYEISPIQNADERTLRVPDADRIWASVGATYRWSENIAFDLAYSHVFFDDASIDRTEGGVRFVGSADTSADIVSVSLKMKMGSLTELLR
jgi:long-chain fatty acid transport protein